MLTEIHYHVLAFRNFQRKFTNFTLQFKNVFGEVYSFEPHIRTFQVLSLNTAHLDNVRVHNYGLSSDESHPAYQESDSQYYKLKGNKEYRGILKVYDSHFDHEIAFVKVGVRENGMNIFQGMKHSLMKYKPVISFDYTVGQQDNYVLLELLESMGYTSFWVPKIHFIENYIKSKKGLLYLIKLFVRMMAPPIKQELTQVDMRNIPKVYWDPETGELWTPITAFHQESKFKLQV